MPSDGEVDLRRGEALVPQEFLHELQRHPPLHQVRRTAVAQDVGRHALQPRASGQGRNDAVHRPDREGLASASRKDVGLRRVTLRPKPLERPLRTAAEGHAPFLVG